MDMSQTVEENGGDKGESYRQNFFLKWDFAGNIYKKKSNAKKKFSFSSRRQLDFNLLVS